MNRYVAKHLESNPGESAKEVRSVLRAALAAHRSGSRCYCGERIRVIGSAFAGTACFTCITGEATPDGDYELAEAL